MTDDNKNVENVPKEEQSLLVPSSQNPVHIIGKKDEGKNYFYRLVLNLE